MNENVKRVWERMFAPPGNGSIIVGPAVTLIGLPAFESNALTLDVPADTPSVDVSLANAGSANTLTIALPTKVVCAGMVMVLKVAQTATACTIDVTGLVSGGDDIADGTYVLIASVSNGALTWVPMAMTAIPAAS